jgi:transcription antitermination factor NusG
MFCSTSPSVQQLKRNQNHPTWPSNPTISELGEINWEAKGSRMENPQWHALLVRRRFERIVALHLNKQGIENYLPVLRPDSQSGAGMDSIGTPLFPGYVFCKCEAPSSQWIFPGVLSTVRAASGIQVIPEQEITNLRRILVAGLQIERWPFTAQGRAVTVENGPLSGVIGILQESGDTRVLVFSIQLIRQSIAISVDSLPQNVFRAGVVDLFREARAS